METPTSIYLNLLLQEKKEIDLHKWLESEKAGHDIGKNRAVISWIRNHRQQWMQAQLLKIKEGKELPLLSGTNACF